MPELPEVETTRRGVAPRVVGRRIAAVTVYDRRLRWPVQEDLEGPEEGVPAPDAAVVVAGPEDEDGGSVVSPAVDAGSPEANLEDAGQSEAGVEDAGPNTKRL
jgi:hypothetical protein